MRNWKKVILTLSTLVLVLAAACSFPGRASNDPTAAATKGDLMVTVTGTGSLATRQTARLSFKTAGKIAEINVKEGDAVMKGAPLASLETDSLALAEKTTEVDLAKARLGLADAEVAVTSANLTYETAVNDLKTTQDTSKALELAVLNAQIGLDQARRTLSGTIAAIDFYAVEARLNKARSWYEYVLRMTQENTGDRLDDWMLSLDNAKEALDIAQTDYDNILAGYSGEDVAIKKKQVEAAELALTTAQQNQASHAAAVALKEKAVTAAEGALEQAKEAAAFAGQELELAGQSLALARKNLAEATLTAPFDGVVSAVEMEPEDAIEAAKVVVRLVSPSELELLLEVDEIDVAKIKPGQDVIISVDAFPGEEFGGSVAAVYPVPTQVTGLVMYNVNLALDAPESSGLKIGMRASADIIVAKKTGVITVPDQAVKEDGNGGYFVNVVSGKNVEQRPVTIGASDGTRTEITGGLSEGESVQI